MAGGERSSRTDGRLTPGNRRRCPTRALPLPLPLYPGLPNFGVTIRDPRMSPIAASSTTAPSGTNYSGSGKSGPPRTAENISLPRSSESFGSSAPTQRAPSGDGRKRFSLIRVEAIHVEHTVGGPPAVDRLEAVQQRTDLDGRDGEQVEPEPFLSPDEDDGRDEGRSPRRRRSGSAPADSRPEPSTVARGTRPERSLPSPRERRAC